MSSLTRPALLLDLGAASSGTAPPCEATVSKLATALEGGRVDHVHVDDGGPARCLVLLRDGSLDEVTEPWLEERLAGADAGDLRVRVRRAVDHPVVDTGQVLRTQPRPWKSGLLVLVALYPLLVLSELTIGRALRDLPFFLRAAVVAPTLVALLTLVILPRLTVRFATWLSR